jgi:hypothetical protein
MQQESQNWIRDFDGLTYSAIFNKFPKITVSKLYYILVSLSVMTLIQVSVLKTIWISDLKIKNNSKITYSA